MPARPNTASDFIAHLSLLCAQLQAQAHPFHLAFRLTSLRVCRGRRQREPIIQAKLDAGYYADYKDSLRVVGGDDKLIIIDSIDLADQKLQ